MKKIRYAARFSAIAAAVSCFAGSVPAVNAAAVVVDYSSKLAELELLLEECDRLNIPTDYETVNYTTIKRFENYVNEDINNGKYYADYNVSCLDELYNEAKTNLEGYIAGTKIPYEVTRADMDKIYREGSSLRDGDGFVFSIGYGHFKQAQNDVENFQNFGTNNIQMEIGPTAFMQDIAGWKKIKSGSPDADAEVSDSMSSSGGHSLKIVNNTSLASNVFIRLTQSIDCKPGVKYKFGCFSRGNTVNNLWMSANGFYDRNYIQASDSWKKNSFFYTAAAGQTTLSFQILSENITSVYLDDVYLYELDENGNETGENLIKNPGFEETDVYAESVAYVLNTLNNAGRNNIGVSLLLSPHYFPDGLPDEIYADTGNFIKYNINAPEARAVIEKYLRALLPYLKGYPALQNICISNEPVFNTTNFYDFYNPEFQKYLQNVHGDILSLNQAYGTNYTSFGEINMPENLTEYNAVCYDWIEFNDKIFTDWHKWMTGIIKEYLPDIPVHSKLMGYFETGAESGSRHYLARGADLEMFDEFSDYAGNDTHDYVYQPDTYYKTMFLYDYQQSVTNKPVYNSEDHIIGDRSGSFNLDQRRHLRNNLWMGAIHGRNMSSIWVWERSDEPDSDFYTSVLCRPDIAAETGKTNLDLARLSFEASQVQQEKPKAAIFYSKPTRLYNGLYSQKMFWAYKAFLNNGIKTGVVSDKSIDKLSQYKLLVIPGAENCRKETLAAVTEFIKNGGIVLYSGNVFSKDEYNNGLDNSGVINSSYVYSSADSETVEKELSEYFKRFAENRISLIDLKTGKAPENLDWQYSIAENRVLINITNLEYDNVKNIDVYLDGRKLDNMKECISRSQGISTVSLKSYTPQLLEYNIVEYKKPEIKNVTVDKENRQICWEYSGSDYSGANVYRIEDNGEKSFVEDAAEDRFSYSQSGTYIICAADSSGGESKGRIVTIAEDMPLTLVPGTVVVKDGYCQCEVSVRNEKNQFVSAVISVQALKPDGTADNFSYNRITMGAGKQDSFKLTMPVGEDVSEIVISAWDSVLSKNLYADTVVHSLSEF